MKKGSFSVTTEFQLLGLSDEQKLQPVLFRVFLSMYLTTVLGKLLIMLVIIYDSHLHTPMYFFTSNMLFIDSCFTITIPKMLANIQALVTSISCTGCLIQMCFVLKFAELEHGILVVMSYGRSVALSPTEAQCNHEAQTQWDSHPA